MSATTSYDDDIYLGFWINRAYNPLRGASLTLDRQNGAVLIAFLALFITAAGRSFWKIVRYSLHIYFSSEASSDGVYHQRQAILRNSQLAEDAALTLIEARFSWRKHGERVDRRLMPIALVAAFVAITFFFSGIFSSRVTTEDANEVLISGRNCGNMSTTLPDDQVRLAAIQSDFYSASTQKASEYLSYAYKCYDSQDSVSRGCNIYTKPNLPYTKDDAAVCPFDPKICRTVKENIYLDSGYLDGKEFFGLNRGPRFQLRLARRCAPLQTENYTQIYEDPTDAHSRWKRYYYGQSRDGKRPYSHSLRMNTTVPITQEMDLLIGEDYQIASPWDFVPIAELNGTNGYLTLMWLESSNVKHQYSVDDPWFKATTAKDVPDWAQPAMGERYYVADDTAQVLGCSTNFELCNPDSPGPNRCYDLATGTAARSPEHLLQLWPNHSDRDVMVAYSQYLLFMFELTSWTPDAYYNRKGLPSLLSRFTLAGLMQSAKIPSNRWQEELEYTFQSNLASIQARFVEFATGQISVENEAFATTCGSDMSCIRLCYSQKIRSSSYYSFSVLGISIILILGIAIILVGGYTESLAELVFELPRFARNRKLSYARAEWHANSTWQLQRAAHEAVGSGTWTKATKNLPVTQNGELLAKLDIQDKAHPRLAVKVGSK